jgi:hypothetical protein
MAATSNDFKAIAAQKHLRPDSKCRNLPLKNAPFDCPRLESKEPETRGCTLHFIGIATSSRPKLVSSGGIPRLLLLIRLGLLRGYRRERAEQAVELIVRASSEKQCGGWAGVAIVAKS